MLDVNEYVNNATDAEAVADSYYTYILAELKSPNSVVNTVKGVVSKRIRNRLNFLSCIFLFIHFSVTLGCK